MWFGCFYWFTFFVKLEYSLLRIMVKILHFDSLQI